MLSLHDSFPACKVSQHLERVPKTLLLQVKTMQQSNQELRTLLNQYLASAVNDELQVPPTQIL